MDREQFLLLKLMEECAEVGQRASKQFQFGPMEIQKNQPYNNRERLKLEVLDLFALVKMLIDEKELEPITPLEMQDAYEMKKTKLQKYIDYAVSLGTMEQINL